MSEEQGVASPSGCNAPAVQDGRMSRTNLEHGGDVVAAPSAPLDLAFQILDVTYDKWRSEWKRADLARELVDGVSPEECRRICRDVLETSHRNVLRWAEKAREWPEEERSPEYAYRSHDVVMRRARESLKEAEIETP